LQLRGESAGLIAENDAGAAAICTRIQLIASEVQALAIRLRVDKVEHG